MAAEGRREFLPSTLGPRNPGLGYVPQLAAARRGARGRGAPRGAVVPVRGAGVVCGDASMGEVPAWGHHGPVDGVAAAGDRGNALGMYVAPHPETVVRIFADLGAHVLASHAGAYLALRALPGPVACPVAGPGARPAATGDRQAVGRGAAEGGPSPDPAGPRT